jgi:hypothetical protein
MKLKYFSINFLYYIGFNEEMYGEVKETEERLVRRGGKDGMQKSTYLCYFTSPTLLN